MWTRRTANALILAASVAPARAGAAGSGARRAEVEGLRQFCEVTHPEGPRAALSADWQARAADLAARAEGLEASRYALEMMRLIGWFGDGHTAMIVYDYEVGSFKPRLPILTQMFFDGLYVTAAKDEAAPLIGARIHTVAGAPLDAVIRRFAYAWPKTNPAWAHRWAPPLLRTPGLLHGLGFLAGEDGAAVIVAGDRQDGTSVAAVLQPRAGAEKDRTALERQRSNLEIFAATQTFGPAQDPTETGCNFVWRPVDTALYVSLDRMGDDDFGKPWAVFQKEVEAAMAALGPDRLIIDLRRNGGGDNTLPEQLRHRIGRSRFNRTGGLYVLISPHTFSAAQNLATRLERETFARFVGQPTGLSPNHFGDGVPFKSTVSGLPIYVSTLRWQDMPPADRRPWLMPDIMVEDRFVDWRQGRDTSLEAALSDRPDEVADDRALTAPWERASQSRPWTPFWMSHT